MRVVVNFGIYVLHVRVNVTRHSKRLLIQQLFIENNFSHKKTEESNKTI
jgi:hypothetical protein